MTCRDLYQMKRLPLFQNRLFFSEDDAKRCPMGDILLVQDFSTGLIHNQAFDPAVMTYDSSYQNEQSLSAVFQRHLENVSEVILKHFVGGSLIEIGCGQGHFLEMLKSLGCEIRGVDPAYIGTNPLITAEYFSPESNLSADGIVMRHVLEHIPNPIDFLSTLRDANGGKGKIYIEAPCFDWICDHRAWFSIFYEHVNYFRLEDLFRIFGTIYEAGHTFNGQYLYVVADLSTLKSPTFQKSAEANFPAEFLQSVSQYEARFSRKNGLRKGSVAVWGASSKGVIFTLLMARAGVDIDMVIDINPAKQGKFLAGTGFQVTSPNAAMEILLPGTDMVVMNGNYLQEVKGYTNHQFNCISVD